MVAILVGSQPSRRLVQHTFFRAAEFGDLDLCRVLLDNCSSTCHARLEKSSQHLSRRPSTPIDLRIEREAIIDSSDTCCCLMQLNNPQLTHDSTSISILPIVVYLELDPIHLHTIYSLIP